MQKTHKLNQNFIFSTLLLSALFLISFSIPFISAEATVLYDSPNLPKVEYAPPEVVYVNYSTVNVNDSHYLEGRDTATLYTYLEGLFNATYCRLTGCNMVGNIDMGANDITDIDKTYFSGTDFISSDDNGHIDIHTGWIDMHGNISTIWNIFFTDAVVPGHNKIVMGGGGDSEMYYNSTDFIIDPDVVGTGDVYVLGDLHADYFIGNGSQLTGIESLWATDGTDVWRTTGDVGIGTTTPNTKLDVNGNASFASNVWLKSNVFITDYLITTGGAVFNDNGINLDFRVESSDELGMLFVDGGTNRVGVNTTTPQQELNVVGDTNITGDLYVERNFTGNQIYGGMWYHNHTGTTLTFGDGTWDTLYFSDADKLNGFSYVGGIGLSSNLTAQVAGTYQVHYMAIGSGQNNHIYLSTILIDGVAQEKCGNHHKMAAGGDVITQSGNCIIDIAVGEDIQLATQDMSGGGDGDYYGGNINLMRIGD